MSNALLLYVFYNFIFIAVHLKLIELLFRSEAYAMCVCAHVFTIHCSLFFSLSMNRRECSLWSRLFDENWNNKQLIGKTSKGLVAGFTLFPIRRMNYTELIIRKMFTIFFSVWFFFACFCILSLSFAALHSFRLYFALGSLAFLRTRAYT